MLFRSNGISVSSGIFQTSPSWVLTFVRWETRDLLRTPTKTPFAVRQPLIVENDCLQVSVSYNKGTLTPNMQAILVETDVNYSTEIHPGDFVFVNMLNWQEDSRRVANKARNLKPINELNDGFKGFFKVQSVRKSVSSEPLTGTKTVLIKIDGYAFTEFNNSIYFNPNLINAKDLENQALYINKNSEAWANLVNINGRPYVQEIITFLISNFIGSGPLEELQQVEKMIISPNDHFLIPYTVGILLGIIKPKSEKNENFSHVSAVKDIYMYLFGIQKYEGSSANSPSVGMNPSNFENKNKKMGFLYTDKRCQGNTILKPEYWNQVTLWSILNQYTNSPLNELYTCFKLSKFGRVVPTVVFRQIPFTSEDFENQKFNVADKQSNKIDVTKFLSLPRWKLTSELVYNLDLGTDEAARINFVQFYARSTYSDKGVEISGETASHNYVFDKEDVVRNGLKPIVIQNQFEDVDVNLISSAPIWARIIGDALIGGHLKINGTIQCVGISDPITVGDNLEFDGVVYHIEQVNHIASINPMNGIKTFRTTLSLSHGVSVNSNEKGTKYAEMTYSDAYLDRKSDFYGDKNKVPEQVLPGVSESQDVVYRKGVDEPHSGGKPFAQPSFSVINNSKDKKEV